MKLWLIQRAEDDWGYDENHGFVIRAASENEAREIASQNKSDEPSEVWLDPLQTTCIELTNDGEVGVILRDFNAG